MEAEQAVKFILENEEIIPETEIARLRREKQEGKFVDFSPDFFSCRDCGESFWNRRAVCPSCGCIVGG